jgi:glycine cleavage system H protein
VAETRYYKTHEYIREDGGKYFLGISEFAQHELGDITFVELPSVGAEFDTDDVCCTVESVKAVAEVNTPVALRVTAVNERLEDEPELINSAAEGDGWMIEVELRDPASFTTLMDTAAYAAFEK